MGGAAVEAYGVPLPDETLMVAKASYAVLLGAIGGQSMRDKCFAAITKNSLATLLSFGEAIAMSKRSPEKLFVLLDMYEIICELQADVSNLEALHSVFFS
ncbi:hypothetical protein ABZP36_015339 [Zizania latifolia]